MNRGDGSWIFWDFDGTLGRRTAGWTACMAAVLDEHYPQLHITADVVRPYFSSGFPWHQPEVAHLDLVDDESWWTALGAQFTGMLVDLGCVDHVARGVLDDFRGRYTAPEEFVLLPDARIALDALARRGWRQLILSNHVPELPEIVRGLGIDDHLEAVLSSAHIGYEKPHPAAYQAAVEVAGSPAQIWMVGDSLAADAEGADAAGLSSILVGGEPGRWPQAADDLRGVVGLVGWPDP